MTTPGVPFVFDKRSAPPWAVYVGRPTKWGNPFVIGPHGTRAEVVAQYRGWIETQPGLLAELGELRGHDLSCYCAPQACHADVLVEMANKGETR